MRTFDQTIDRDWPTDINGQLGEDSSIVKKPSHLLGQVVGFRRSEGVLEEKNDPREDEGEAAVAGAASPADRGGNDVPFSRHSRAELYRGVGAQNAIRKPVVRQTDRLIFRRLPASVRSTRKSS